MRKECRHNSNAGCVTAIILATISGILDLLFSNGIFLKIFGILVVISLAYAVFQYVKGKGYSLVTQILLGYVLGFFLGGIIAVFLKDKDAVMPEQNGKDWLSDNLRAFFAALEQRKLTGLALGLLVALLITGLAFTPTGQLYENKLLDLRFRLFRDGAAAAPDIIIADIGGADIAKLEPMLGRWPWPRAVHAVAVEYLAACGAKVIGFDVIFAEQSFSQVKPEIVADLRERLAALDAGDPVTGRLALRQAIDALDQDNDGKFARAARESGRVVQAMHFNDAAVGADTAALAALSLPLDPALTRHYTRGVDPLLPFAALRQAAKRIGHITMMPDDDGPVRSMPVIICDERDGRTNHIPTLSLAMFLALREQETGRAPEVALSGAGLRVDEALLPLDRTGRLNIDYAGGKFSYTYVHYAEIVLDVLRAGQGLPTDKPREYWRDKIVFVGTTAAGLMDLRVSPFEGDYPGVELHANLLDQMRSGRYLRRSGPGLLVILLLALGCGLGLVVGRLTPLGGAGALLLVAGVYAAGALWLFAAAHVWLDAAAPLLTLALTYLVVLLYRFISEEKEKRFVRHAFQHYLSHDVVDAVLANRQELKLGGERRELTVLFSDIRSFTTMSEQMAPEEVVARLNEYLTAMTDIVLKYRGMLDKYVGDAVMAVFGAPLGMEDHAVRACRVALEMMSTLRAMQERWRAEGKVVFDIGIGVNTGPMFVGNMGSKQLFDYTVIGDNVNLGARLEGTNKEYKTNIIISEYTYARVKDMFTTRYLDEVTVKGKEKAVKIYELIGEK